MRRTSSWFSVSFLCCCCCCSQHINLLLQLNVGQILAFIIESIGYQQYLIDTMDDAVSEWDNVKKFVAMANQSQVTIMEFINQCLVTDHMTADDDNNKDNDEPMVTIGTIHAIKGMQWAAVFILQCNEHIYPLRLSSNANEEWWVLGYNFFFHCFFWPNCLSNAHNVLADCSTWPWQGRNVSCTACGSNRVPFANTLHGCQRNYTEKIGWSCQRNCFSSPREAIAWQTIG